MFKKNKSEVIEALEDFPMQTTEDMRRETDEKLQAAMARAAKDEIEKQPLDIMSADISRHEKCLEIKLDLIQKNKENVSDYERKIQALRAKIEMLEDGVERDKVWLAGSTKKTTKKVPAK